MSDYKASLPSKSLEFSSSLSTLSSSSMSGVDSMSGSESGKSMDRFFSRELSRASEQAAPSNEAHGSSRREKLDSSVQKSQNPAEQTQRRDQKTTENSANAPRKATDNNAESRSNVSTKDSQAVERSGDRKTAATNSASEQNASDSKRADELTQKPVGGNDASQRAEQAAVLLALPDVRHSEEKSPKLPHSDIVATEDIEADTSGLDQISADKLGENGEQPKRAHPARVGPGELNPVTINPSDFELSDTSEIDSESMAVLSMPAVFNSESDSDNTLDSEAKAVLLAEASNAENATTQPKTDSIIVDASKNLPVDAPALNDGTTLRDANQPAAAPRLTAGEQLLSGQLASRQAQLFNAVTVRRLHTDTAKQESGVDEVAEPEAVVAPLTDTIKTRNAKSLVDGARYFDASTAKLMLAQTPGSDVNRAQAAELRAQAAEIESASNLATTVAVQQAAEQKAEHQPLQVNMAQLRQMTQLRQMAQQQAQNSGLAMLAATVEPGERAAQSSDNTFHSLPGGIVTAPQVQRVDTGNAQTINAPINIPVLQNDADKAMAGNIRWMVNEGVKNAVVNVTPNGMGPISVSIGIEKDQMNVSIVALQGSTREALDSMLPRLREQLAAQGHDSVKVGISDGRAEQSDRGYGHQFSGDQDTSPQDQQSNSENRSDEKSDNGTRRGGNSVAEDAQGLLTINENGSLSSRYDMYV